MIGTLPAAATRFRVDGSVTVAEPFAPRAPGPAEVVIDVAGSAVGAAPGCEVAGTVVATGEAARDWLDRRVVVPRVLPCGECERCRRGRTASCPNAAPRGGPATCETVPARYLLSVEPPLWPEGAVLWQLAALADAAATPYGALVRGGVAPGDVVAVVGGGVRGRLAARLATAKGALTALLVAPDARDTVAGLEHVLDGGQPPAMLLDRLRALSRERGVAGLELKVIETTGRADARRHALALSALAGATCVLLADGDGLEVPADLHDLASSEARVLGAAACHPDLLPELAALVVRGDLRLDDELVAWPFTEYAAALAARREGRQTALPVLVPDHAARPPAIDTRGAGRS